MTITPPALLEIPYSVKQLLNFSLFDTNEYSTDNVWPLNVSTRVDSLDDINKKVLRDSNYDLIDVMRKLDTPKNYDITLRTGENTSVTTQKIHTLPTDITEDNVEFITAQRTDVLCWWCCHSLFTFPGTAPIKRVEGARLKPEHLKGEGCFCSFSCAAGYLRMKKRELG